MTDLEDGLSLRAEVVRGDGTVCAPHEAGMEVEVRCHRTGSGVRVQVRARAAVAPVEASVRLALTMTDVDDPWWLVPGLFYGENRPADCLRVFPRFAVGPPDPDRLVSDRWEFRADRAATPAVFVWGASRGVALVSDELSEVGMVGLGLRYDAGARSASIHLGFPYREGPVSYDGSDQPAPPDTSTWCWEPDRTVLLEATVHLLDADRHGYAGVLRSVRERNLARAPLRPWVGVEEAADLAAHGLHRWHYDPDPGVLLETVSFDRGISGQDGLPVDRQAMHVGWVSGLPWAYALLLHGLRTEDSDDPVLRHAAGERAAAARAVIDFTCSALSPSGTFWGTWYRQHGWSQSWSPVPGALHARTLGEATLFLLRAVAADAGAGARPRWVDAARSNLDAVVERQRPDGNLGAAHHAATGEVLSWAGAGGLTWVAALAEAVDLDGGGRYLAAAERAGSYYARFVDAEFLHGAAEDVDLAPTSEDGYAAVLAYVALHRRTGDPWWLDLARRAADWSLTFRYTYDVDFDPRTTLGRYRFQTRGADQASPSNQHLHSYGLVCTKEMVELSAALGDDHYAERALEHLACFRQLVPRVDGELNAYRGMVTERYYQTACFQPKGMVLTLSHAWSVGVLLLACEQAVSLGLQDHPLR